MKKPLLTKFILDSPYALTYRMVLSILCMGAVFALIMAFLPICKTKEFLGLVVGIILSVFLIISSYITVRNSTENDMKRPVAYTRTWVSGRYLACAVIIGLLTYYNVINPITACIALLSYNLSAYTQEFILRVLKKFA